MKGRAAFVVAFVAVSLGSWALMKPPVEQVSRLANGELVQPDETVTRAATGDPVLPAPMRVSFDQQLLETTVSSILDQLGFEGEGAEAIRVSGTPTLQATLADIVADGIRAREADHSIAARVNAGFVANEFEVPAALITASGQVDIATLLGSVVTGAKLRLGQDMPEGATAAAIHTVTPSDSLAGLAAAFYGDALVYDKLLKANENIISSPMELTAGMQLRIPPI